MPSLQGKRALITGGSRGLGAVIAKMLSERGVVLCINYASSLPRAEETLKTLQGSGHVLAQGDAFSREGIKQIVEEAKKGLGGLDIVISNAGWTKFGAFSDLNAVSDEDWNQCHTSNIMSHLWLMQACEDELKKNKGSFIISSSAAGLAPSGSSMAYSVTKAGAIHLAKCLASACAPNVRVNAVAPGMMLTEWSQGFTEEKKDAVRNKNTLKQISDIDDVARTYVALCENGSITGQAIKVNSSI